MSEVTITVSGVTGSGKSAICGEIEILCIALGLKCEWVGGQQEKNLTHADYFTSLELYKPSVRIVEFNYEQENSLHQRLLGRAQFLRDKQEVKTPELLEAAASFMISGK